MSPALSELDRCVIHRAVEDLILITGDSIDRKAFDHLAYCFHPESKPLPANHAGPAGRPRGDSRLLPK